MFDLRFIGCSSFPMDETNAYLLLTLSVSSRLGDGPVLLISLDQSGVGACPGPPRDSPRGDAPIGGIP